MVQKSDEYNEFRSDLLRVSENRSHKIKNSLGVYDAYKYIRKNGWMDIGHSVSEHDFYKIIRRVNDELASILLSGGDIVFPERMGKLEVRKRNSLPVIDDRGKVKTSYAIDWDKTIQLWFEDEEAFNNKTLVKLPERNIFRVRYNKSNANYNNQSFIDFQVNRDLKTRFKHKIKNNELDAFVLW